MLRCFVECGMSRSRLIQIALRISLVVLRMWIPSTGSRECRGLYKIKGYMSYSLNSLKGVMEGVIIGAIKGILGV